MCVFINIPNQNGLQFIPDSFDLGVVLYVYTGEGPHLHVTRFLLSDESLRWCIRQPECPVTIWSEHAPISRYCLYNNGKHRFVSRSK